MATEKDFELLDDFLSNRMQGQERVAFEEKLKHDPALQQELKLQQALIKSIRTMRAAELKSMLSQTVVPGSSASSALGKIGAFVLIAGVVATGLYFYFTQDEGTTVRQEITTQAEHEPVAKPEVTTEATDEQPVESTTTQSESKEENNQPKADVKIKQQPVTKADPSTPVKQPELDLYDPTKDLAENNDKPEALEENRVISTMSTIPVETDNTNKKLDFHYQFKDGKLFLYGSFEKDLYEILEFINNNKRTVFLYYNSKYYLLDEAQLKPTPLKPITDNTLTRRLDEHRGKGN